MIVVHTRVSIMIMTAVKRVTANLPEELLREAMGITGHGITDTIVAGLEQIRRSGAYATAMALKGKIRLTIDLERSRERRRR